MTVDAHVPRRCCGQIGGGGVGSPLEFRAWGSGFRVQGKHAIDDVGFARRSRD